MLHVITNSYTTERVSICAPLPPEFETMKFVFPFGVVVDLVQNREKKVFCFNHNIQTVDSKVLRQRIMHKTASQIEITTVTRLKAEGRDG